MLNARIRKAWLASGMPIGLIGTDTDLTYAVTRPGRAPAVLTALHNGSHDFAKVLSDGQEADDHRGAGRAGPP